MGSMVIMIQNESQMDSDEFESLCDDILSDLIDATPVDSGYCQSQWQIAKVDGEECEIDNDCDYVSYLEDGWSSQAPNGIAGPVLDDYPGISYEIY